MLAKMFPWVCVLPFVDSRRYRGKLFVLTFLFIIGFIAPMALISILFIHGKLFLPMLTLNKWINKKNLFDWFYSFDLSSNINEVIRVVLKSFYEEFLYAQKSIKSKQATFARIFFIRVTSTKRKQTTFTEMFYKHTKRKQAPFAQKA